MVSNACSGRARMTTSPKAGSQRHAVMWSVSPHHPEPTTEGVPMRRASVELRPVMSVGVFPDGTARCSLRRTAVLRRPGTVGKKMGSAPRTARVPCLAWAHSRKSNALAQLT